MHTDKANGWGRTDARGKPNRGGFLQVGAAAGHALFHPGSQIAGYPDHFATNFPG